MVDIYYSKILHLTANLMLENTSHLSTLNIPSSILHVILQLAVLGGRTGLQLEPTGPHFPSLSVFRVQERHNTASHYYLSDHRRIGKTQTQRSRWTITNPTTRQWTIWLRQRLRQLLMRMGPFKNRAPFPLFAQWSRKTCKRMNRTKTKPRRRDGAEDC